MKAEGNEGRREPCVLSMQKGVARMEERIVFDEESNLLAIRERYPEGLHFVVGDLHGQVFTLMKLMEKIQFQPDKDKVYFVGDYNAGGDVRLLLQYLSEYYQEDYETPGFHLIRGNHERELMPVYTLSNLPDVMVIRGRNLNFYIAHAGMVSSAFRMMNEDMEAHPDQKFFAYRLEDNTCCFNAPLRQLVWSMRGLYSQRSHWHVWPSEEELAAHRACIIHGHSPYCFFKKTDYFTYGDNNLFFAKPHVFFSEELHSFNIDSNIKGRFENGENYRGLTCLCMEVFDEMAAGNGVLTTDMIRNGENGLFSQEYDWEWGYVPDGDINRVLNAAPVMKIDVESKEVASPEKENAYRTLEKFYRSKK